MSVTVLQPGYNGHGRGIYNFIGMTVNRRSNLHNMVAHDPDILTDTFQQCLFYQYAQCSILLMKEGATGFPFALYAPSTVSSYLYMR